MASSSDDRMNEPPTSLGLVPHQVSYELLSDALLCKCTANRRRARVVCCSSWGYYHPQHEMLLKFTLV